MKKEKTDIIAKDNVKVNWAINFTCSSFLLTSPYLIQLLIIKEIKDDATIITSRLKSFNLFA